MRAIPVRRFLSFALALICCLGVLPVRAEGYPVTAYAESAVPLLIEARASSKALLTIPKGNMAILMGESGDYYLAMYNGTQGYIAKSALRLTVDASPASAGASGAAVPQTAYSSLSTGSRGTAVAELQTALKLLGFYTGEVDGQFGTGTKNAVTAFQKMNGQTATGVADAAMQRLLYEGSPRNSQGATNDSVAAVTEPVRQGSSGAHVTQLQTRLQALGYYTLKIDGKAGSNTVSAIRAFQKKNGLAETGVADETTQIVLYSTGAVPAKAAGTPTPTPYPTNPPASKAATFPFTTYTTAAVNLRASASTSSSRLLTVPKGAEISVLSISGDFLRVTYSGKTGYLVSDYAVVPSQYLPGNDLDADTEAQQRYDYLQSGSMGKNVTVLQEALKELGFYSGTADGAFGAGTAAAVKSFQKKNGIRQDGVATPELQKLIFEGTPLNAKGRKVSVNVLPNAQVDTLSQGKKGDQVADLQKRLNSLGLYSGSFTGVYDSATVSAVKTFQRQHSLTVDGVAGPKTLKLLYLLSATPTPTAYVPATPTPTPAPTAITRKNITVLSSGSRGDAVVQLQERLVELGYYACAADGVYDADEVAAVREFQRKNGLTIDGIAGFNTQIVLYSDAALPATTAPLYTAAVLPAVTPTPIVISTATQSPSMQSLKPGDQGDQVKTLQRKLQELGYYTGSIDGIYGSGTQAAVREFQRKNGLGVDGLAGTQTLTALYLNKNAVAASTAKPTATVKATATPVPAAQGAASLSTVTTLQRGDKGDAVKAMQERLKQLGYLAAADGIYGPQTYNAVVSFQKRNGLTADGIAGKMTLTRLNSASAVAAVGSTLLPSVSGLSGQSSQQSSSGFTAPKASQVQYANWYSVIRSIAKKMPDVVIYDPDTGLHFNLHMFSFGKHADAEPPTAADTAVLNQIVGVNTWTPKYVWVVFQDGQVFIGSIHSHGHEVDHTAGNDLEGHICLHFPRVMSEAEATGPYAVSHQNEINWGWEITKAMAQ